VIARIADLMKHETAGDPMTDLKWTHKTTQKVASELSAIGIAVSSNTVAKLLRQMGYSLRVNHKQLSRVCKTAPEVRDAQFRHIAQLREDCAVGGLPLISVDAKKKELIGLFKNPGVAWNQQPVQVSDHDFGSEAVGKVVPYGIYDVLANLGTIYLGTSIDTAEFAVDAIEAWWLSEGRQRYEGVGQLIILADGGGSNGSSNRLWKCRLHQFALRNELAVTVAHYPPGASKWNPIEHRLFSEISKNWAGRPLESLETTLNYIRTTRTKAGLQVRAHLLDRQYDKGLKITDAQLSDISIATHEPLSRWNYTLNPHPAKSNSKPGVIAA